MSEEFWSNESSKHGGGGQKFADIRDFKFKDNSAHKVRVLPNKDKAKPPAYGYIIHWVPQVNAKKGRPIVHKIDKRCELCDYISELWAEINRLKEEEDMTDKSPEVIAIHAKMQPVNGKKRYDMNVIDRDEPYNKEGKIAPKRLSAPSTVWKPLFEYAQNPKWGSPSNEATGYDFDITTEGIGERREYTIVPDRTNSPLNENEVKALELCYDLEKLRKTTSPEDIRDILTNAKAPYNDIVVASDTISKKSRPVEKEEEHEEEVAEEPKQEIKHEPKPQPKTEVKKEPEPVKEIVKQEERKISSDDEVEEPSDEVPNEVTPDSDDDANDINNYECKGDYDKKATECTDCPVQKDCVEFQPILAKAKELKLDISPERKVDEIKADVKSKEPKEPEAAKPVRGKKREIPF